MGRWIALLLGALLLVGASAPPPSPALLIFTHSTGYRHESIEPGARAIAAMAEKRGYRVTTSADPALFDRADTLRSYAAIVLLSTTTNPSDPASEWFVGPRRDALQAYVRAGGGIVGIHAAADSHYHWPWYGQMIGGWFESHPRGTPTARLHRHDTRHPATARVPDRFERVDEWYYYKDYDPRSTLLLSFDPAGTGGAGVNPKPIAWAHGFEGGRVFYTGLGHTVDGWNDPVMVAHLTGGIDWAAARTATPRR